MVRVVDRYGNGVGNVSVQWATCDGQLGPAVETDGSGYSSTTQPTEQPSGDAQFCTMASVSGLNGSPVEFHYTVTESTTSASQLRSTQRASVRASGLPPVVRRQRTAKSAP